MRVILQVVYGKNKHLCYSGSHAVRLATNHSTGKTGTLLADVCFKVQCLKSLSNLVFTHLSKVDELIYATYFQQKDIHTFK